MADTKAIKNKLKTVGNIKKITRAMEMVARSKMKKAIDRALALRPFAFFGLEFLVNFSYHSANTHYLYQPTQGTRTLILHVAGNKGLCGGYNGNMFREVRRFILREGLTDVDYIAVGKYAVQHVHALKGTLLHSYTDFSEQVSLQEIQGLVDTVKAEYATGLYNKVMIAHTNFVSALSQKPVVYQLLPLSADICKNQLAEVGEVSDRIGVTEIVAERDWSSYVVEPSADDILDVVIPKLVTVQIYQSLLDARASEEGARMVAMKNATENAEDIESNLMLSYNHIRQEGITRELSEIAAGTQVTL